MSNNNDTNWRSWAWAPVLVFAGILLPGLAAPSAHADVVDDYAVRVESAVCTTLDSYPSVGGVLGVGQGIVADSGFTYAQAGRVIGEDVQTFCPRHLPLLQQFLNTYAPSGSSGGGTSGMGQVA